MVTPNITISAIGELLGVFDGTNGRFDSWECAVRLLKNIYKLDDEILRIFIGSILKGEAITWFDSRPDHIIMSADNFLAEIKKMYHQSSNRVFLRKEVEERVFKRGEIFSEYMRDKTILANRVPTEDSQRINCIVDNIPDVSLPDQTRILRFGSIETYCYWP